MLFGGALGLVHAVFCVHLRADQIVVGTAINILALGLTDYVFRVLYGIGGTPPSVDRIPQVSVPGLRDIPRWIPLHRLIWRTPDRPDEVPVAGQYDRQPSEGGTGDRTRTG
jgi:ABC-type uncharacterized transport system permease subunit